MPWLLPGSENQILNRAGVPYGVLVMEPGQARMVYCSDHLSHVWADLQGEGWIRPGETMVFNKPEVKALLPGFSEVYSKIGKVYMTLQHLVLPISWNTVMCRDCGGVFHFVRHHDGRSEEIATRISTVFDAFEEASRHVRTGTMDVDTAIILIVTVALLGAPMDWDERSKRESRAAERARARKHDPDDDGA